MGFEWTCRVAFKSRCFDLVPRIDTGSGVTGRDGGIIGAKGKTKGNSSHESTNVLWFWIMNLFQLICTH